MSNRLNPRIHRMVIMDSLESQRRTKISRSVIEVVTVAAAVIAGIDVVTALTTSPAHANSVSSTYSTPSTAPPAPVTMPPMTSTQTMRSSSCPKMSSMSADGMNKMTPIIQNATTADYRIELGIGPTANMLMMCQVTSSATSGEVMVAGQMSPMSMTGNTYHLELHVYNIKTGAAEVVPIDSISITVTSTTGTKTTIPIAEMFDISQGPTDFHYGNNVQLAAGNYTVDTKIGSEKALFKVLISAMLSGMSMK
jgi:hypothetical protein